MAATPMLPVCRRIHINRSSHILLTHSHTRLFCSTTPEPTPTHSATRSHIQSHTPTHTHTRTPHTHIHTHTHEEDLHTSEVKHVTKLGALVNAALGVSKGVTGCAIGSTGMIADAANSCGDLLMDAAVYFTVLYSRQGNTPDKPWVSE